MGWARRELECDTRLASVGSCRASEVKNERRREGRRGKCWVLISHRGVDICRDCRET